MQLMRERAVSSSRVPAASAPTILLPVPGELRVPAAASGFGGASGSGGGSGPAGASGGGGTEQPLASGEDARAKQIYDYLVCQYHFTPAQAAGIVGNMEVKSGLNPSTENAAEGAIGLCQWEAGRRTDLENFAVSQGRSATEWKTQVDFMVHELGTDESGAGSALLSASTATQAATVFDEDYEPSAGITRSERIADADNVAAEFG